MLFTYLAQLLPFLLTNDSFAVNIQSEEGTIKPVEESGIPLECVETRLDSEVARRKTPMFLEIFPHYEKI